MSDNKGMHSKKISFDTDRTFYNPTTEMPQYPEPRGVNNSFASLLDSMTDKADSQMPTPQITPRVRQEAKPVDLNIFKNPVISAVNIKRNSPMQLI